MKYLIAFLPALISCSSNDTTSRIVTDSNIVASTSLDTPLTRVQDTQKSTAGETTELKEAILGIWTGGADENAAFVIKKDRIEYPDVPATYKYTLSADSMKIFYEDYADVFAIEMKGADTLVMTGGGEKQMFYRMKN